MTHINSDYLTRQLITCIGNKRALLDFIGGAVEQVKADLGKEKLVIGDLFSGSGATARYFKGHAAALHVNDLEPYAQVLSRCFLMNPEDYDPAELDRHFTALTRRLDREDWLPGFISRLYAPADDRNVQPGERVFYTTRNANYLDTARQLLAQVPEPYRTLLLGPLLAGASVHTNTSGVFKGFYKNSRTGLGQFGGDGKNALSRILAPIRLEKPVLSEHSCPVTVYRQDANALAGTLPPLDLAYLDPPYNQHPYGSNYFMLNLLTDYRVPEKVSRVSGIPADWNKSAYNRRAEAAAALEALCRDLPAQYLLISFSDDGFISREQMLQMLQPLGDVTVLEQTYNTFRGSRNLRARETHVKEILYLVKKR